MPDHAHDRSLTRRLLHGCVEAYLPAAPYTPGQLGWIEPPVLVRRAGGSTGHPYQALVGRVREGVVVIVRGAKPPFAAQRTRWPALRQRLRERVAQRTATPDYPGRVRVDLADATRLLWEDADGQPGIRRAIQMMLDVNRFDRAIRPHLYFTGHDLGGALAGLAAMRAARHTPWRALAISLAVVAAPRIGDAAFAHAFAAERMVCLSCDRALDPGEAQWSLPVRAHGRAGETGRDAWYVAGAWLARLVRWFGGADIRPHAVHERLAGAGDTARR